MKREDKGSPPAQLITVGARSSLSPFRQSDWGGLLDATGLELSCWRTLSPQRYALLSLVCLGLGALYQQPLLIFTGSLVIAWVTRRARLEVSAERGCLLSLSLCGVTYQRRSLPLWTPLSVERHGALSVVWLGDMNSSYHVYELMVCHQERAEEFKALYREGARRAQASRLVQPVEPKISMSGEWQVSLIELLPLISGPRSTYLPNHIKLSWWAPSGASLLGGLMVLTLSPFSLILSPEGALWPLLITLGASVMALFGVREELSVTPERCRWTRRWMSFPTSRQEWSASMSATLISDPVAPHGRHVLLYEAGVPSSVKAIGGAWDSDWIWSQLTTARTQLQA